MGEITPFLTYTYAYSSVIYLIFKIKNSFSLSTHPIICAKMKRIYGFLTDSLGFFLSCLVSEENLAFDLT